MTARGAALGAIAALIVTAGHGCGRGESAHPSEHASHVAPAGEHEGHGSASAASPAMSEVEVPDDRRQLLGVRTAEVAVRPLSREIRTVGLVSADERKVRRIQSKISGWVEGAVRELHRRGRPRWGAHPRGLQPGAPREPARVSVVACRRPMPRPSRPCAMSCSRLRGSRLRLFDVSDAQVRELERTREPKRRVVLHSPIAGYVTFKSVLQGTFISPEMELYTVSDLSHVWVWAEVTEDEIPLLARSANARRSTWQRYRARARPRSYSCSRRSTPRPARCRSASTCRTPTARCAPGMYATVRIERPLGEVLALPEEAVIDTGVRRVVFIERSAQATSSRARSSSAGRGRATTRFSMGSPPASELS